MSVLKNKRAEGKLQVLIKARSLASYTAEILGNEKTFPKRSRWIISQQIADEAIGIFKHCRRANAVNVETKEDFAYRHEQQTKAYSQCESLLSLIEIAYNLYHIESKRIEYWTGLVVEVETLLSKWRQSDKKRFADFI